MCQADQASQHFCRCSTQSETELKTSTKKSTKKFNNSKEFLFNMLTESSNMIAMNFFQQEQNKSLKF